ncbi:hypothetical protein BABINDRAFT_143031 [Babjeviella inositovora NRRL Y-12698]|uniref:Uncharacterized protein n=1 Tax=Babjeviella inositovora NRRL Y-12698 TaxID=984486 RepID=A0A1E3QR91_9ASCO|nr:uncharacterized protein BABINDRAFT_143031 [Babjeviella inositovora NRRL Y-12698]ODQ79467.1 hypothetical protein BABINDRAFT_143031 [Babjeviella inositovora NRRL Y-12698]
MYSHDVPFRWREIPLEIVEKIISYLPASLLAVLRKSQNAPIAAVARRYYYSRIELVFNLRVEIGYHSPKDFLAIQLTLPEFEELANSPGLDQLRIQKLYITVYTEVQGYRFLHQEAFTKVSTIVTDVMLEFFTQEKGAARFDWDWLPPSPRVQKCIREISVRYTSIDPNVLALPSNLRKLEILHTKYPCQIDENAPEIQFPPKLEDLKFCNPWIPMSKYGNLPSTLRELDLVDIEDFSVQGFNALHLPHLKALRLTRLSGLKMIAELFELPPLLELLDLRYMGIKSFEQRKLPPSLKVLSFLGCPIRKFCTGDLPDSLTKLVFDYTQLTSADIRTLTFPPNLKTLEIIHGHLTSVDFVNALPPSLELLLLHDNSLGSLCETDEDEDTARAFQILFPKSIEAINLGNNSSFFATYSPVNLVFPPNLKDIGLQRMGMRSVKGLKLPRLLQFLNLHYNSLTNINAIDIPPTLANLLLSNNCLESFTQKLPDTICSVDLEDNRLTELVGFHLPVNCTTFEISHNPLQRIQITNADDPNLKLRYLCLNGMSTVALCDIFPLPNCIETLVLQGSQLRSLAEFLFPMGLKRLEITLNRLVSLENVNFPPHLEILRLHDNELTSLANVQFPETLLCLELELNMLASVDGIRLPPKLKVLDLESNAITAINDLRLPDSLEELILANQESEATTHDEISLADPRIKGLSNINGITKLPSNLEFLDLSNNDLSERDIRHLDFPVSLSSLHVYPNRFTDYLSWLEGMNLKYPDLEIDERADWDNRESLSYSDDSTGSEDEMPYEF